MGKIYDVAVIGGGPGGYVAAIQASKLGFSTILIEKDNLGGVCLNWGCIPTKSLLKISKDYDFIRKKSLKFGITVSNVGLDIKKAVAFSRKSVEKLLSGIHFLMKKNNISLVSGTAMISANKTVVVDKQVIEANNIIIATGAKFRDLPNLKVDGDFIWDAKCAMIPKRIPRSVLIVGSGAIGMEFASFYNAIGTSVTVVEIMPSIMPIEDEEIATLVKKSFEDSGIVIYTSSKVVSTEKKENSIIATVVQNNKESFVIEVEKIIVAVGVVGNSECLGLESFQSIKVEKSWIRVNDNFETGERGIYAIGDVIGAPCLAHKASHEGMLVAKSIKGEFIHKVQNIPFCTYSDPEIASLGMTEKEAIAMGYQIKIGRSRGESNGKSVATGDEGSFVKIIFNKLNGEILGAHMFGSNVTEMIQGLVIAKQLEATEDFLKDVVFPHPTISEIIYEAVLDADGDAIHS